MNAAEPLSTDITQALKSLRRGGIGAFPTETVYGLGADALNVSAIERVFKVKGRPLNHPLIVHLAATEPLDFWARDIPLAARQLAQAFWPGPLTLVLPKHPRVPAHVTGGQDSIALRVPKHPIAQALLQAFGGGLVGPSANRFGALSPTSSQMVRDNFGVELDFILEGGPCAVGIESSIVQVSDEGISILREGMISAESLHAACKLAVVHPATTIRVPGQHTSHYAPGAPLRIVEVAELEVLRPQWLGRRIGLLGAFPAGLGSHISISTSSDPPSMHKACIKICVIWIWLRSSTYLSWRRPEPRPGALFGIGLTAQPVNHAPSQ